MMNEENEWDHGVFYVVKDRPAGCIMMPEVVAGSTEKDEKA